MVVMQTIARGLKYVDLKFLGYSRAIATAVLQGPSGIALIDPGPATCLDTLRLSLDTHGMAISDIRAVLLTHIHLDHAGATGSLVRENSDITVYVHENGARHIANPEKLLASAGRLYGNNMDRLWGEVAPIPLSNIKHLIGGEKIDMCNRTLEVIYMPGHASHHVGFFDSSTGVAFVGDTAGMRLGKELFAMPPTPPPDIDVEAWFASVDLIRKKQPSTLFVTHFGPYEDVGAHLDMLLENLATAKEIARKTIASKGSDDDKMNDFIDQMRRHIRRHLSAQQTDLFDGAPLGPLALGWLGLARYWKKQGLTG